MDLIVDYCCFLLVIYDLILADSDLQFLIRALSFGCCILRLAHWTILVLHYTLYIACCTLFLVHCELFVIRFRLRMEVFIIWIPYFTSRFAEWDFCINICVLLLYLYISAWLVGSPLKFRICVYQFPISISVVPKCSLGFGFQIISLREKLFGQD